MGSYRFTLLAFGLVVAHKLFASAHCCQGTCVFPALRCISELPMQAGSGCDMLWGRRHGTGVALPVSRLHSSLSVRFLS